MQPGRGGEGLLILSGKGYVDFGIFYPICNIYDIEFDGEHLLVGVDVVRSDLGDEVVAVTVLECGSGQGLIGVGVSGERIAVEYQVDAERYFESTLAGDDEFCAAGHRAGVRSQLGVGIKEIVAQSQDCGVGLVGPYGIFGAERQGCFGCGVVYGQTVYLY